MQRTPCHPLRSAAHALSSQRAAKRSRRIRPGKKPSLDPARDCATADGPAQRSTRRVDSRATSSGGGRSAPGSSPLSIASIAAAASEPIS